MYVSVKLQHLTLWAPRELNCIPILYVATVAAIFMEISFLGECGQKENVQFSNDCDVYGIGTDNDL